MKKCLLFVIAICVQTFCIAQPSIQIDSSIYGQTAYLTDTVGIDNATGGKLEQYWQTIAPLDAQNYVKQSRAYFMRYGGILVEQKCLIDGDTLDPTSNINLTIDDYVRKAIRLEDNGITAMFTMPLNPVFLDNFPLAASRGAFLVKHVNDSLKSLGRTCVFTWIYSNEPEDGGFHNYNDSTAPQKIHDYIAAFHDSVSTIWDTVSWGGAPNFIGPELYSFDNYKHYDQFGNPTGLDKLIKQLCGAPPYTSVNSILPFLSEFSWHFYPFNDESSPTIGIPMPTDSNVVDVLATGVKRYGVLGNSEPLQANIDSLKFWLNAAGYPNIKLAITEANICNKNDVYPGDSYNRTDDSISGNGANSYRAAQLYTELMSICMKNHVRLNMWSGIEGCGSGAGCDDSLYATNIGYLNADPSKFGGIIGGKKPIWYLFKLVAENFHGHYIKGNYVHNNAGTPVNFARGIKTFASVEGAGIKIIIMNYNDSTYKFGINFNSTSTFGADTIKLTFPGLDGDPYIALSLDTDHHYYPTPYDSTYLPIDGRSTVLLTFDCHGILLSRQDYSEENAASNDPPHIRQVGNTIVDASAMAKNVIKCGHAGGIGGTINSNTTYTNDTVYINSDILLAGQTELTFINCLVVVAQGAKIKTTPPASIVLKKSVMVGCDGKVWKGIEMLGNYQNGERLLIENSSILNASKPVTADRIADMKITKSVFANGETAIELNRSKEFSITESLILGYTNSGIKITNATANYVSEIKDNRVVEAETAVKLINSGLNMMDFWCNDLYLYHLKGIESSNSDVKEFGTTSLSSANRFIKSTLGMPLDYIDHTGTPTKYYYGPSEIAEFSLPLIANIPILQATADRTCKQAFRSVCPPWISVGIEEQKDKPTPQMLVYPNPSTGSFTINFSNLAKGNWTLNVHDVLGRLINSSKVDVTKESTTLQIAAKGLYFISLQNGNNRITQKILVE